MSGLTDLLGGGIVKAVGDIASDLITTEKERRELDLRDKELDQRGDMAQIGVNTVEAQSNMLFVSGWRPAVGWAGAMGLWCAFVPKCIALTGFWMYAAWVVISRWNGVGDAPALPVFPDLGITDLLGLLASLLGMGAMRHRETMAGVARVGLPAATPTTATPPLGERS